MEVAVKFFARCREIVGEPHTMIEVENGRRVQDVIDLLINEFPALKDERVIVSLNHNYADPGVELKDGDELALFPPVSGG